MKKQLFLIILAIFAIGMSRSYGQCTPGPLSPAPGVLYPYDVVVGNSPDYNGDGTYDWYVTQNVDLLLATAFIAETNTFFTVDEATAGYSDYHDPAGTTTNTIGLTWTPASVGQTFYLVVRYTEANGSTNANCSAENIRVWEIKPINTFLLTINPADADGTINLLANACPGGVIGAIVTPGTPTVEYTYGTTTIYYNVTASGILGEWRPSLRLPVLAGLGQNYASADWTEDGGTTWNTFGAAITGNTAGGDFVSANNATVTNVAGTAITIRIVINNDNFESLAIQNIVVGIDGYLPTAYTVSDIVSITDCTEAAPFAKQATYPINPRPTITPGTTMPAFITKAP